MWCLWGVGRAEATHLLQNQPTGVSQCVCGVCVSVCLSVSVCAGVCACVRVSGISRGWVMCVAVDRRGDGFRACVSCVRVCVHILFTPGLRGQHENWIHP